MRSNIAEVSGNHMQSSEQTSRAEANLHFPLRYPPRTLAQDWQVFRKQVVAPDKQRVQNMALRAMRACSCVSPDTASNIGEA